MRGRPRMTEEAAAQEAAKIINVAWTLKYRPQALEALGFTREQAAKDYVLRRHRGRVGELVGDAVRELFPAQGEAAVQDAKLAIKGTTRTLALNHRVTRNQLAVSLVLDHGFPRNKAARFAGIDPTNLKRSLEVARAEREAAQERAHALNTQVTDAHQ